MRIAAMFFLFFAEAAWAANEGGSTERMDFANTAAFHSVFEDHAASGLEEFRAFQRKCASPCGLHRACFRHVLKLW